MVGKAFGGGGIVLLTTVVSPEFIGVEFSRAESKGESNFGDVS
jgi:hypothetical protein